MRELWRRLWHGRQLERGLDEEIRFHIDQQTEKNMRAGMTAGRSAPAGVRQVRWGRVPQGAHARRVPAGTPRRLPSRRALRRAPALPDQGLRHCRHPDARARHRRRHGGLQRRRRRAAPAAALPRSRSRSSAFIRSTATDGEPTRCRNRTSRTGSPARAASARWRRCRPARAPVTIGGEATMTHGRRRLARVLRRDGRAAARRARLPARGAARRRRAGRDRERSAVAHAPRGAGRSTR